MNEERVVTLPSSEEITNRLAAQENNRALINNFYPIIAKNGGQEMNAYEITEMFIKAIQSFMDKGYTKETVMLVAIRVPLFMESIIDDEMVADEAKFRFTTWKNT